MAILTGNDERFDHLSVNKVPVELIQLAQPEVVTVEIQSRFRRIVRISPQVAQILSTNAELDS